MSNLLLLLLAATAHAELKVKQADPDDGPVWRDSISHEATSDKHAGDSPTSSKATESKQPKAESKKAESKPAVEAATEVATGGENTKVAPAPKPAAKVAPTSKPAAQPTAKPQVSAEKKEEKAAASQTPRQDPKTKATADNTVTQATQTAVGDAKDQKEDKAEDVKADVTKIPGLDANPLTPPSVNNNDPSASMNAMMPSLWGGGNPVSNPDSVENMLRQGLDAMAERVRDQVAPKDQLVAPKDSGKQRRVRVMSDFHIGGCWAKDEETRFRLMTLLDSMAQGNSPDSGPPITHLILLGDIWDWWLVPLAEAIPRPNRLFHATDAYGYNVPEFISLIKRIAQHTKILAVRGNHDDDNDAELTKEAFGDSVTWMEDGFEMNGMWFEHGHIIDMYSNPPTAPDGQRKRGFGYFETRAGAEEDGWQCKHRAKRPGDQGAAPEWYIKTHRNVAEMMVDKPFFMDKNPATVMWQNWYLKNVIALPQNFVKTHLRWVLKQANPSFKHLNYEAIPVTGVGKDQKIEYESMKQEYTIGDVIKDHTYDMELLAQKFGSQHAMARIYCSGMENHFKWVRSSRKHSLVVTGHTHNPYIVKHRRDKPMHSISDDVVYANTGAWAQDSFQRDHSNVLDIVMDQLDEEVPNSAIEVGGWYPSKVSVYEYPDMKPLDEVAVPFPKKKPGGFDLWLHPDPNEMVVGQVLDVRDFTPELVQNTQVQEADKTFSLRGNPQLKDPTPSWEVQKDF